METNTTTPTSNNTNPGLESKIKSNKTPLLIIGLAILTGLLLVLALSPKKTSAPAPATQNQEVTTPMETTLTFGDATSSGSVDNVGIIANTGSNNINGVQLELSFDPKLITNIVITPGSFIQNPVELLNKIDYTNGKISYVLGAPIGSTGVQGTGTVANISFTEAGAPGQTITIKFLPKTLVSTQGFAGSSLKSTADFTKTIGQPTSVPSATTSGQ